MMRIYLLAIVLLLSSCDVFDKEEEIPSFIVVKGADVITNPLTEGAPTHAITDISVFADDEFVGTFELPATVPILASGPTRISLAAGIKNNGISSDRIIYPFYDFNASVINLIPDAKLAVSDDSIVTFSYFQNVLDFEIEDFETTGMDLEPTQGHNADFSTVEDEDFTGMVLKAVIPSDTGVFEMRTEWNLTNLPKGNNMFLEIDYRGNHPLEIGILGIESTGVRKVFALGILPSEEWTKVYVDLTDEISRQINTNNFEIYLESRTREGEGSKELYIDNLKFIYP